MKQFALRHLGLRDLGLRDLIVRNLAFRTLLFRDRTVTERTVCDRIVQDRVVRTSWQQWLGLVTGVCLIPLIVGNAKLVFAAERITAQYGLFERSLSIESLKAYAEDGTIDANLRPYIRSLDDEQLAQLNDILQTRLDFPAVAVSQFLYTQPGEVLLRQLGTVIRTDSGLSGFYALRSALILAASDPEGLTLLNVLEKMPLPNMIVDLDEGLQLAGSLERLVSQSQAAIALVKRQSQQESLAQPWSNPAGLPDLQSPGPYTWTKISLSINNPFRTQAFPADIYLPQNHNVTLQNAPIVIISHGLGSDRTTFAYLAEHLASYGFVVAVPEHPGSDSRRMEALLSGRANEITEPSELINRPLDIKYLIDTLTTESQTDTRLIGHLDLQRIGVIGQSYGGYTALALAGAKIDLQNLSKVCADTDTFNLALLLECRARELTSTIPDLHDDRVKAIIVINPVGAALFGESGFGNITIPILIMSGTDDTVSPALPEQIRPFTWLASTNKYLVLLKGGTHFSTLSGNSSESVDFPSAVTGPDPRIAFAYLKGLGTAFLTTHLTDQSDYSIYLTASYASVISRSLMPVDLVRSLTSNQLKQAIE